jgi:hypothetical protein
MNFSFASGEAGWRTKIKEQATQMYKTTTEIPKLSTSIPTSHAMD